MTLPNAEVTQWRKSKYSNGLGGECVELASMSGQVLVRDSMDPDGPVLALTPATARNLVSRVRERYA